MRHFMTDFIEHGLRKAVQENAIHCAKNVGYFENLMKDQTLEQQMRKDQEFELCLGKYSDSYEQALDVFGQHLKSLKQATVVTHSQPLQSTEQREKRYLMGSGPNEPIYDKPDQRLPPGMVDLKLMEDFVKGVGSKNSKAGSPAEMQQMPFNYYKEQSNSSKSN